MKGNITIYLFCNIYLEGGPPPQGPGVGIALSRYSHGDISVQGERPPQISPQSNDRLYSYETIYICKERQREKEKWGHGDSDGNAARLTPVEESRAINQRELL